MKVCERIGEIEREATCTYLITRLHHFEVSTTLLICKLKLMMEFFEKN